MHQVDPHILNDSNARSNHTEKIGKDLWKQLKRISIPLFSGSKRQYESWRAAFNACVDQAPATPEYKLLQLRQHVSGEALKAIENLGYSSGSYAAALSRLERKFGGRRRQITLYIEELEKFRPIRMGQAKDIEKFSDLLDVAIINLREAGRQEELGNGSFYVKLQRKIPETMLAQYHRWICERYEVESVESLHKWITQESEFQTIASETICGIGGSNETEIPRYRKEPRTFFGDVRSKSQHFAEKKLKLTRFCKVCNDNHGVWLCEKFKKLNVANRWEEAKKLKLCYSCLGDDHMVMKCPRRRKCGIENCERTHNKMLHGNQIDRHKNEKNPDNSIHGGDKSKEWTVPGNHLTMTSTSVEQCNGILSLRTVPVVIKNGNQRLVINALLDDASTKTYLNTDVAAELGLSGQLQKIKVNVLNDRVETFETMPVEFKIESLDGKIDMLISAYTTEHVTGNLKVVNWNYHSKNWKHLDKINFPKGAKKSKIDMLIGMDYPDLHYSMQDVRGNPGEPIARLTPLGWTCVGTPGDKSIHTKVTRTLLTHNAESLIEINNTLRMFWEVENEGLTNNHEVLSKEEQESLNLVKESIQFKDNHYQVSLPWKENPATLPENYNMAKRRLENTEKKLLKNPKIGVAYNQVIDEYIQKGYVRKIPDDEKDPENKWYLPHFAVVRPDKDTTKVRIVFDGAATYNGVSINDIIHPGPKLQQSLLAVLLRFRRHPVAIVCDIAEMYLRIGIHPKERPFHRFLWRSLDVTKEPEKYEFQRVVFGFNCSPFLAQFVSREHATKMKNTFPRAAETVLKSTYMDDGMDSVTNDKSGIELFHQLSSLWKSAGMHARKWMSNSAEVLKNIPTEDRAKMVNLEESYLPTIKTLGVLWIAKEDVFSFKVEPLDEHFNFTKRNFLRKIATIFDPLGLLSPFIVRAKIILQEIWSLGVDWDEKLDEITCEKIQQWFEEAHKLENVKVARCLRENQTKEEVEVSLQAFSDASENAYGAVVYLRCRYKDGYISSSMAASKSKVAPLVATSIPRLELMGAVLALQLANNVAATLKMEKNQISYWTDNLDVLWWIRGCSRKYKTFVANRVGEIQTNSDPERWNHVPTLQNPADLITRGMTVDELINGEFWWQGPAFLCKDREDWPQKHIEVNSAQSELRKLKQKKYAFIPHGENNDRHEDTVVTQPWRLKPSNFSSWKILSRITAWVHRFLLNCRSSKDKRNYGELQAEEIVEAELSIIKQAQQSGFKEEYQRLRSKRPLSQHSSIYQLLPKLDSDGIMRIDGRLKYAEFLSQDMRNPILLPRKKWLTKLIVKQYHDDGEHICGTNHTLASLSARFWIVSAREEIKDWERQCNCCKRRKAKISEQVMAPIPTSRLQPSLRAFDRASVDYAGPFITIQGRSKRRAKRYLCLFTCMATRAIHLEMAYSMDTDSFLNAFYRMASRRGMPQEMYSDNGGNFVGADRELKELVSKLSEDQVTNSTASKGVK